MSTALTQLEADMVYDILMEECGASDRNRDEFLVYVTRDVRYGHEFRFMGHLGFGGKFYNDGRRHWSVACYPEHRTPSVDDAILSANARLKDLANRED